MTCAPVDILAIVFDDSSEMIEPVKPITAENMRSCPNCRPVADVATRSSPNTRSTIVITAITAMLVRRNRAMRFMKAPMGSRRRGR